MASGKRVFGYILFFLALLGTLGAIFILYAKSQNDTDLAWITSKVDTWMMVVAIGLGVIIVALLLLLLVRTGDERRKKHAFQEEQESIDAERARQEAFDASLIEPDNLGKGPDMVVYNLPTIPAMYHAWERLVKAKPARGKNPAVTGLYGYVFPRTVDDAVYTNCYLPIDNEGTQLKLRILIAGPKDAQKKELPIKHTQKKVPEIKPESIPEPLRSRLFPAAEETTPEAPAEEQPILATTGGGQVTDFRAELDARLGRTQTNGGARAFYDYQGDIHDVEDIEGIGRIYGEKLREAGVHTTARLAYEQPEDLAARVGVPVKTVVQWQHMGELMKVKGIGKQYAEAMARAGIQGIAELKKRSPDAIADQVNQYLSSLETNVLGTGITAKRVEGWQKAAAGMKRVRLKVPDQ